MDRLKIKAAAIGILIGILIAAAMTWNVIRIINQIS
jgi:hypothetical protein